MNTIINTIINFAKSYNRTNIEILRTVNKLIRYKTGSKNPIKNIPGYILISFTFNTLLFSLFFGEYAILITTIILITQLPAIIFTIKDELKYVPFIK